MEDNMKYAVDEIIDNIVTLEDIETKEKNIQKKNYYQKIFMMEQY